MSEIARAYTRGELCGWLGARRPELVRSEFDLLRAGIRRFQVSSQTRSTAGRKAMLYEVVRKVLGKDTENYPQKRGDCVSFGAKNAVEYLTCCEIAGAALLQREVSPQDYLAARRLKWRPLFPPYFYGTGRIYVGHGQIPANEDGSMGSWMAEAVQKYGSLFSDEQGVPAYSAEVSGEWGSDQGILDKWQPTAKPFLVKSAALINSWDDLVSALANGYPCTTASNIGYDMEAGPDGFHAQTTNWGHQMMFCGGDESYTQPYAIILNNWGDVHGHLKDFQTGDPLPVGVLRVRREDAEKHIAAGETFAYSQFDGFPEQQLDKALFLLI